MSSFFHSARDRVSGHLRSRSDEHNSRKSLRNKGSFSHATEPEHDGETPSIAQTVPAWHVHGSNPTRKPGSTATSNPDRAGRSSVDLTLQPNVSQNVQANPQTISAASVAQTIPGRQSSLRSSGRHTTHNRGRSDTRPELDRIDSESAQAAPIDEMGVTGTSVNGHLNRKPVPTPVKRRDLGDQLDKLSLQNGYNGQGFPPRHDSKTHLSRPLNSTDLNIDQQSQTRPYYQAISRGETNLGENKEHLKLPPGFQMQNSEHTVVDTAVRPAVTHEVIHRNIKEIRQESITRDIHVHHYYTYTQPIKVVEILPAKHYVLDGVTGVKIEIPAPPGWQMPESLQPYVPDISQIKPSVRHYLVDDEHPHGISEPAPEGLSEQYTATRATNHA